MPPCRSFSLLPFPLCFSAFFQPRCWGDVNSRLLAAPLALTVFALLSEHNYFLFGTTLGGAARLCLICSFPIFNAHWSSEALFISTARWHLPCNACVIAILPAYIHPQPSLPTRWGKHTISMFTRNSLVATEMSGQNGLHRSSWKVEAIRRGDLKISEPIPIDGIPLPHGPERDPITGKVVSTSQSHNATAQEDQRPYSPPNVPKTPVHQSSDYIKSLSHQRDISRVQHLPISPLRMHQMNATSQEHVIQPIPSPSPSHFRASPESMNTAMQKRNRKSGLRHVFRKILGRRDRDKAEEHGEASMQRGHNYHNSVSAQDLRLRLVLTQGRILGC